MTKDFWSTEGQQNVQRGHQDGLEVYKCLYFFSAKIVSIPLPVIDRSVVHRLPAAKLSHFWVVQTKQLSVIAL